MSFETEVVACICHSSLHHQKPDFEGQSVIKTSSYLLPFVLEAHRESLPRSCETSARRLSAESAEVYSTADLPASAAHTFPFHRSPFSTWPYSFYLRPKCLPASLYASHKMASRVPNRILRDMYCTRDTPDACEMCIHNGPST